MDIRIKKKWGQTYMEAKQFILPAVAVVLLIVVGIIALITVTSKKARKFAEPAVATIAIAPESAKRALSQYHIKSSYNSCASGDYQNDYVTLAALTNAMKNGCRLLDFEIYDSEEEPIVAVSNSKEYTFKGSYNSIPLAEVLKTVKTEAFTVSNGRDPLFLQFRIKSDHVGICTKTANLLKDNFGDVLLPNQFNYQFGGKNIGSIPLKTFIGKVFIIVDMTNPVVAKSSLAEFVNLGANTSFNRVMSIQELAHNAPTDILDFSAKYMLTCTPELDTAANYDSSVGFNQGAQIIAMKFQRQDGTLDLYNKNFNGYAFLLKAKDLQHVETVVEEAPDMPEKYNYGTILSEVKAGSENPFTFEVAK